MSTLCLSCLRLSSACRDHVSFAYHTQTHKYIYIYCAQTYIQITSHLRSADSWSAMRGRERERHMGEIYGRRGSTLYIWIWDPEVRDENGPAARCCSSYSYHYHCLFLACEACLVKQVLPCLALHCLVLISASRTACLSLSLSFLPWNVQSTLLHCIYIPKWV